MFKPCLQLTGLENLALVSLPGPSPIWVLFTRCIKDLRGVDWEGRVSKAPRELPSLGHLISFGWRGKS